MSTNHKVIFYNFPNCSMLLDEIVMNNGLKGEIEFHTLESIISTIDFIKDNPESFLIFYNDSPSDYIKAKSMLKQLKDDHKTAISSIAIVNNTDGTVQKSLRELGVKDIFTHDYHSADIIEKMEFHLKQKEKKETQPLHKKVSQHEADKIFNLVVDKNDYRQEEFSQVLESSIDAKNINLESGDLNINLDSPSGKPLRCSLENFSEQDIEISLEGESSYQKDDKIEMNIIFQYNRCKVEILIDGVIESCEKTSSTGSIVTIKLNNDERISLENFMSLYQQRQKSIDDFMELAKGY